MTDERVPDTGEQETVEAPAPDGTVSAPLDPPGPDADADQQEDDNDTSTTVEG